MSSQLEQRSLLGLVIPLVIIMGIIISILITGVEDFGKLLLDKNPFAIAIVGSVVGAVLYLVRWNGPSYY